MSDYSALDEAAARKYLPAPAERKAIRKASGLSLRSVAAHCGVSAQGVCDWENEDLNRLPHGEPLLLYVELLASLVRLADAEGS
jgi:DNA-binding transcriptional regulator YiaG